MVAFQKKLVNELKGIKLIYLRQMEYIYAMQIK